MTNMLEIGRSHVYFVKFRSGFVGNSTGLVVILDTRLACELFKSL